MSKGMTASAFRRTVGQRAPLNLKGSGPRTSNVVYAGKRGFGVFSWHACLARKQEEQSIWGNATSLTSACGLVPVFLGDELQLLVAFGSTLQALNERLSLNAKGARRARSRADGAVLAPDGAEARRAAGQRWRPPILARAITYYRIREVLA
eukprot:5231877-Pleurochrysis_carterae.AAC.1